MQLHDITTTIQQSLNASHGIFYSWNIIALTYCWLAKLCSKIKYNKCLETDVAFLKNWHDDDHWSHCLPTVDINRMLCLIVVITGICTNTAMIHYRDYDNIANNDIATVANTTNDNTIDDNTIDNTVDKWVFSVCLQRFALAFHIEIVSVLSPTKDSNRNKREPVSWFLHNVVNCRLCYFMMMTFNCTYPFMDLSRKCA